MNNNISLRKIAIKDIFILYNIFSDPGVSKHQSKKPMKNISEAIKYYCKNRNNIVSIILKQNKTIGFIEILSTIEDEINCNFIIQKSYRNKKYMTYAINIFLSRYLGYGIKRVIVFVHPQNIAAIHVLKNNGFAESKYVKNMISNLYTGKKEDRIVYTITL